MVELTTERYEQFMPYLEAVSEDDGYTLGEVREAYREAVKDVHPDAGGSQEEFKLVDEAAEHLKEQMSGQNKRYQVNPGSEQAVNQTNTGQTSPNRRDEQSSFSLKQEWLSGLREANDYFGSDYELSEYEGVGDNQAVAVFNDDTSLGFAIEMEREHSLLSYETTYFVDGEGEVASHSNEAFGFQLDQVAKFLQGSVARSVKNAEAIKKNLED
jgi:hypothetical protein